MVSTFLPVGIETPTGIKITSVSRKKLKTMIMKAFCYRQMCAVALLAGLFSGCAKSSVSDDGDGMEPMRFGRTEVMSRAAVTNDGFLRDGNSFRVWGRYHSATDGSFTPTNVFEGTEVTREGEAWTYTDTRYWLPGFSYNFRALYPAGLAGVTFDEDAVLLSIADYDGKGQDDILYATPGEIKAVQGAMPAVALDFRHVLSRVVFEGAVHPVLNMGVTVTSVKVYGVAVSGSWRGEVSAENPCGTWTAGTELASADEPYATAGSDIALPASGEARGVLDVLMVPQAIPVGAEIEITYRYADGAERTSRAGLNMNSGSFGRVWKPGAVYRYRFTIYDADYILFERPVVEAWVDADGGNYIIQ